MKMNEATLNHYLDLMTHDATGNNKDFLSENEILLERYLLEPVGDEQPERSKVQSNDVADVVEADMPSLVRTFLGSNDILRFKPNKKSDQEDVKEAELKTKYVKWQIFEQDWSFRVLHGFIKNAEIQKLSVVKYFIEETTEVEEIRKTGLSDEELTLFQESLEGEDVEEITIDRTEDDNTVVLKVSRRQQNVIVRNVPLESFRMTRNAEDKNDADLVGDVTLVRRGDLLAQGFTKEEVDQIPLSTTSTENVRLKEIRDRDEGGKDDATRVDLWALEEVEIEDLYVRIDYDGDNRLERRHIMRGGDVILVNEVFNHVPYALLSSVLMPHKAIGRSRAEIALPTQEAKTAILRGIQDNIYSVNNPRIGANELVNMDDLLDIRLNGVVRTEGEGNPGANLFPIEVPYIGDKALQVIQYWDMARAQTTGSLMASQGLEADDLGKETATRFEGVQDASKAKVELVARVLAETGFRDLFEGVAWLDSNFQNTSVEVEILGEELKVDPRDWKYKHKISNRVGLGAGDDETMLKTLTGMWVIHQQLAAMNSPMTDEVKRFNILKGIAQASGIPDEEEFFNDPNRPEQLLMAENEIYKRLIPQLQQQIQSNPLAEAEQIKAQSKLIEAQSRREIDIASMLEDQRRFNMKMMNDQKEFTQNLAAKITEMELKYQKDVGKPGPEVNSMDMEFDPFTGLVEQLNGTAS